MSSISPAAARFPADGRSTWRPPLGDELLARQAARGSERAFAALYERYYQPLYRYCRSIVRNDADAQDALQSAFTGALAALQRGGRNAPLRPWLYRIAHNESISLLRRRKRDSQYEAVTETSVVGSSAEEEAAGRARWQAVVEDLAELPERQRGSLLLRELAGLSHEEIALALGMSVGAAKQAIFEARQGLTELEEGRAMTCDEIRQRISAGDRRVLRGRRVSAHLRACGACEAFALAIPARQSDLRALAPALPPATAAALLGRVIHTASSHGGASAGSAATAGAIGKAGTVIGWKAVATVGVLASTAAGVTGLAHVLHHARAVVPPAAPAAKARHAGLTRSHTDGVAPRAVKSDAARLTASHAHTASDRQARASHRRTAASMTAPRSHHSTVSAGAGAAPVTVASAPHPASGHAHSAPGQVHHAATQQHPSRSSSHTLSSHKRAVSSPTSASHSHRATTSHSHSGGSSGATGTGVVHGPPVGSQLGPVALPAPAKATSSK